MPFNARTRVHEYGGRAYLALDDGGIVFSNLTDQRLYRVAPGGSPESFFVSDGFVEVRDDVVRVVVESGEHRGEIDVERAQEAEKRAREKIASSTKQVDVDLPRAEAALRRARARERLARKAGA